MADQHDKAIDRALAALSNAAPPDGIEVRVAQRLQSEAMQSHAFRWRDVLTGSALAGAWWRGAIVGAAIAAVAVSTPLILLRGRVAAPSHTADHHSATTFAAVPPAVRPVEEPHVRCAPQQILRVYSAPPASPASTSDQRRIRPIPTLALTDQERALVRLAQTANASELVSIDPENMAKAEAQEDAEFKKFFTPPPGPIPAPEPASPDITDKKGDL